MIYLAFGAVGAVLGAWTARKRGGSRLDIAQYAAGYGIAFMLVGLIVTIILDRTVI